MKIFSYVLFKKFYSFYFYFFVIIIIFCLFVLFRAATEAYGGSQARGLIGSVATSLRQSHDSGSESCLWPTTTAHGNAGSLTHWSRPGIKPTSSWILVRFISTTIRQELYEPYFWEFCPHHLITSQSPHLQRPLHWGLGSTYEFWEDTNIFCNRRDLSEFLWWHSRNESD